MRGVYAKREKRVDPLSDHQLAQMSPRGRDSRGMPLDSSSHWLRRALVALVAVALAAAVAFAAAVSLLKGRVAQALGPSSEMAALRIGWSGVVIDGLRIAAPAGWPAKDALRGERVTIVPTLRSLVSGDTYRIWSVTVARPYLSVLREPGGSYLALPGMHHGPTATKDAAPGTSPSVSFGEISLVGGVLELFDATVATPPLEIRLEQIAASVHDVNVPGLHGRSAFELDGVVKGLTDDGHAHVAGWIDIATRDSSIATQLRSLDLVPLQPYLIRKGEAGVRGGRFDLDLQSEVRDKRLRAEGTITFVGLHLDSGSGALNTFMGISQSALLASLEEKGGRISADFTLEGDLDSPEFALNEALSTRLAYSLAETLGVGLEGFAEGAGRLGLKGGQAAGDAAKGVGGAIRDLFEDKRKR
jgi:Domain of Unknown Function (DUF748)